MVCWNQVFLACDALMQRAFFIKAIPEKTIEMPCSKIAITFLITAGIVTLTNCRYPSSQEVSTYSHCVKSVTWGKCSYNFKPFTLRLSGNQRWQQKVLHVWIIPVKTSVYRRFYNRHLWFPQGIIASRTMVAPLKRCSELPGEPQGSTDFWPITSLWMVEHCAE